MERKLTIFYTSDSHGYFAPVDYARDCRADTGLANCMANFTDDGNTLIIDGGDTLQGSPFTYWLYSRSEERSRIPAELLNLGGYQFITLGNHDFNYGVEELERYLDALRARCLCANVEGLRGVEKTAVVALRNGLRVGLAGVTSHFIPQWEKAENIAGLTITDAFEAAAAALRELRAQKTDLNICIYHGGFENDVNTGAPISSSGENQGWRICRELDFDVLLTGHQHMPLADRCFFGTYTCQTPDRAKSYVRMDVTADDAGTVRAVSQLCPAGSRTLAAAETLLAPLERETAAFLDTALGHLDTPLLPDDPLTMAAKGSLIANFFNQVQLEVSGADLSCTCLGNEVKGLDKNVTVRDIVATYLFPNTLKTLKVNRAVLKTALERSAAYFALDDTGALTISESFLKPLPQHYNFDFISGLEVVIDVRRPVGERVVSMRFRGEELEEDRSLSLCLNNYRASGAGGYEVYTACEIIRDQPEEISEQIIRYVDRHRDIRVDKTQWLKVQY